MIGTRATKRAKSPQSRWRAKTSQLHRTLKAREAAAVAKGKTFAAYGLTLEQFREWLAKYASFPVEPAKSMWICGYCFGYHTIEETTIDHATPMAHGGLTEPRNFVVCCRKCNERKGDMTAADFRHLLSAASFMSAKGRASLWRRLTSATQRWRGNA